MGSIGWIMMIKSALVSKKYRLAGDIFFTGAIIILREIIKYFKR